MPRPKGVPNNPTFNHCLTENRAILLGKCNGYCKSLHPDIACKDYRHSDGSGNPLIQTGLSMNNTFKLLAEETLEEDKELLDRTVGAKGYEFR